MDMEVVRFVRPVIDLPHFVLAERGANVPHRDRRRSMLEGTAEESVGRWLLEPVWIGRADRIDRVPVLSTTALSDRKRPQFFVKSNESSGVRTRHGDAANGLGREHFRRQRFSVEFREELREKVAARSSSIEAAFVEASKTTLASSITGHGSPTSFSAALPDRWGPGLWADRFRWSRSRECGECQIASVAPLFELITTTSARDAGISKRHIRETVGWTFSAAVKSAVPATTPSRVST